MVILLSGIIHGADTTEDGSIALKALRAELASSNSATLSFDGIDTATSSFVNAALVPLLEEMSLEELKSKLRVVRSTKQINEMIRRCLSAARPAA